MKHIILPAAALLFLLSCKDTKEKEKVTTPKSYPVYTLQQKDTTLEVRYVAEIQARKNVEIRNRFAGSLEHIYVDEGETVHKGQLLFSINDDELQIAHSKANAALNSAIADAKVAQVEVERVKKLVDKKIISETELDLAEAKYNAANAKIEELRSAKAAVQKHISYTKIYAPFDGVIDRLPLKAGSILAEGSLLTTLSDIHSVLAYFHISENEYLRHVKSDTPSEIGQRPVRLELSDGTVYSYPGKIVASESEIDENTGSIAIRADFPNPQKILRHGSTASVIIEQTSAKVMLVPQKSALEIQDKYYVFVLDKGNIVRMREFVPVHRVKDYYIINNGLHAGDTIIYEGIQSIREGEKITPIL